MDYFNEPIRITQSSSYTCEHMIDWQILSTKGSFFSEQWKTLLLLWEIQTNFHGTHQVTLLQIEAFSQQQFVRKMFDPCRAQTTTLP